MASAICGGTIFKEKNLKNNLDTYSFKIFKRNWRFLRMKKILVTGGRGFFASRFTAYYQGKYEVLALKKADLDVTDEKAVLKRMQEFQPNYVIHTAAIAVTAYCNKNPDTAHKINVDGSVSVAKAAKAVGAKLIFISTEQLFNGNQAAGPFGELDIPNPDTVYGQNKLEAESLLKEMIEELWIVRFTWLFGMPDKNCGMSGNILWDTISAILQNEKIYASPYEYRGMTYVHEMVEQIIKILNAPYGTYHLGASNAKSRYEIVKEIFIGLGLGSRIEELLIEDKEKYAKKNRDVRLNNAKAKQYGMIFSDSSAGIEKCIADYGLKIK